MRKGIREDKQPWKLDKSVPLERKFTGNVYKSINNL